MKASLDESQPLFQQIAQMIIDDIIDDRLKEGERIPSENELSSFYNINRATVRNGLQMLVDKAIIYKKRGIGMFVKEGARAKLREERIGQFKINYVTPLKEEAKRLGIGDEEVIRILREGGNK